MFKLPDNLPAADYKELNDITDWVEWLCLINGTISLFDALRPIMRQDDEVDTGDGIDKSDDLQEEIINGICNTIDGRIRETGSHYPFELAEHGMVLRVDTMHPSYYPYGYLLLSSRLNMDAHKSWAGTDGTKLLELFSGYVAENYLGEGAEHQVFGTGGGVAGMKASVELLIENIKEGRSFQNEGAERPQDDGVDVIAWKHFADRKAAKLIVFAQCKTGQTWGHKDLTRLVPSSWCKTWLTGSVSPDPIKAFFCSKQFPFDKPSWVNNAGIVFDRFRIMHYYKFPLPEDLLGKIQIWVDAIIARKAEWEAVP